VLGICLQYTIVAIKRIFKAAERCQGYAAIQRVARIAGSKLQPPVETGQCLGGAAELQQCQTASREDGGVVRPELKNAIKAIQRFVIAAERLQHVASVLDGI